MSKKRYGYRWESNTKRCADNSILGCSKSVKDYNGHPMQPTIDVEMAPDLTYHMTCDLHIYRQ